MKRRSSRWRVPRARSRWPPTWPGAARTSSWAETLSFSPTRLHDSGIDALENSEEYEKLYPELLDAFEEETKAGHDEVVDLGGLYVVGQNGTSLAASTTSCVAVRGARAIGGEPVLLVAGDDLMRLFKSDIVEWVLQALKMPERARSRTSG